MLVHNTLPGESLLVTVQTVAAKSTLRCKIFIVDPAVSKNGTHVFGWPGVCVVPPSHYFTPPPSSHREREEPTSIIHFGASGTRMKQQTCAVTCILGFLVWAFFFFFLFFFILLIVRKSNVFDRCHWGGVIHLVDFYQKALKSAQKEGRGGERGSFWMSPNLIFFFLFFCCMCLLAASHHIHTITLYKAKITLLQKKEM